MKIIGIFLIIVAALIIASVLGNAYEGFGIVVTDTSGNTTNYATHTSQGGSSTFSSTTDASGNKTFDNYNHYDGTSSGLITGTTYYGPNGGSATVITTADGKQAIRVTLPSDPTPVDYIYVTVNKWQGPNGEVTLVSSSNGGDALKISLNNGATYLYVIAPGGGSATASTGSTATANYETTYYGSTGTPPPPQSNYYAYNQPISSTGATVPPPPPPSEGIPRNMIPPGQEDLYILKSTIIPPICPACPPVINTCPQSSSSSSSATWGWDSPAQQQQSDWSTKYSAANTKLPTPVLNSFATFGM